MLELRDIVKEYPSGEDKVVALKGINIKFRHSEFVSILGQSGCGKTTTLNIIGGLDQYTSGDLIINGVSTKDYKDRDWDSYRNHSVGFVFQSYNLIPHQTVLQNVEIALTLSGVSKAERKERAIKALEEVGLGNQLSKKPNQMSGGQMQRVAIARALVNDPDIILADEPTGALDTETSVQVMEILKKISKDRLIVMVTHNPELAEKYSSRIIRMLDGEIVGDSKPLTDAEIKQETEADNKRREELKGKKRPSMSFGTSFKLSLNNLVTKKGRTMLTSFAGSIGIIGIALILAISQGTTAYIDAVQETALSSYPLTIQETTVDVTTLMQTFMTGHNSEVNHEKDAVYVKSAIYDMMNALNDIEASENDLRSFKEYLDVYATDETTELGMAVNGIQYSYDLDLLIYTQNVDGTIIRSDTTSLLNEMIADFMKLDTSSVGSLIAFNPAAQMNGGSLPTSGPMSMTLWQELLPGMDGSPINDLITKQYDMIYGSWPNSYDEVLLVLDENNELDDMTLYALGLIPKEEIDSILEAAMNGEDVDRNDKKWSYEEICGMTFRTILNSDCYTYDEATGRYTDKRETDAGLRYLYDNGIDLKVTGIIRPKEDSDVNMLSGTICYTKDLTKYVIDKANSSDAIKAQQEKEGTDIFTGLPFESNTGKLSDEEKEAAFRSYISEMSDTEKASVYVRIMSIPDDELVKQQTEAALSRMSRADMEAAMTQGISEQMSISADEITEYLASMTDEEMNELFSQMMAEQVKMQYAEQVSAQMAAMTTEQLAAALDMAMDGYSTADCTGFYDDIMEFSDSTYEDNLKKLGGIDLTAPKTVNIYASSFENKDIITDAISKYNEDVEEIKQIKYTDYVGLMMSSVTSIINAITYVLIAFVAISLIVSSIMIGVITLISVQERTKEIGILRAIGASKKDVSSMFNAETMIIGFTSGLMGVLVTYLLCIPINIIVYKLTEIAGLKAILPIPAAVILVIISVCLTLISGIIPSRSAAKKDPVVALRTE